MLLGGGTNTTDDADQDISFMNFAGGFFGTTGFMLDGSWDTDTEWGGVIFVPSVDSVQEFKVQNNSFTAQYGWSTGNVINVVTKSGTNTFHGVAWDFYQNQNLNAVPYFSTSNQNAFAAGRRRFRRRPALYSRALPAEAKRRSSSDYSSTYRSRARQSTPTRCPTATSATATSLRFWAQRRSGTDGLGRPIYVGQIYDPRSGHRDLRRPGRYQNCVQPIRNRAAVATTNRLHPQSDPREHPDQPARLHPGPGRRQAAELLPRGEGLGTHEQPGSLRHGARALQRVQHSRRPQHQRHLATRISATPTRRSSRPARPDDWGNNPAGPGNARPNNRWGMWAGYSLRLQSDLHHEPDVGRADLARNLKQPVLRIRSHVARASVVSQAERPAVPDGQHRRRSRLSVPARTISRRSPITGRSARVSGRLHQGASASTRSTSAPPAWSRCSASIRTTRITLNFNGAFTAGPRSV